MRKAHPASTTKTVPFRRGSRLRSIPPLPVLLFRHTVTLAWLAGIFAARWLAPACACCLLLCWVDARCRRPAALLLVLIAFVLGLCAAQASLPQVPFTPPAWAASGEKVRLSGTVSAMQGMPDGRLRVLLENVLPAAEHTPPAAPATPQHPATQAAPAAAPPQTSATPPPPPSLPDATAQAAPVPCRLVWTWDEAPLRPLPGQRVEVTVRLRSSAGFANMSLPDYGGTWAARGIFWRAWSRRMLGDPVVSGSPNASAQAREWLRELTVRTLKAVTLPSAMPPSAPAAAVAPAPNAPDSAAAQAHQSLAADVRQPISPASPMLPQKAAFIPALLFGDRTFFSQDSITILSASSLLHSIALSGQHLAFMTLLALGLAHAAGVLTPRVYQHLPRPAMTLLLALPLALIYLWLGDAPPSLMRAACMLGLLTFWHWKGQLYTALDIVLDAVLLMTVCQPLVAYEVGLQLSALAVGSLGCAMPLLRQAHAAARTFLCGVKNTPLPARPSPAVRLCLGALDTGLCSFTISLALLPPAIFYFHNTGWWFPLNVLWLPVLALWVLPLAFAGLALLACGFAGAGSLAFQLTMFPCGLLIDGLNALHTRGWLTMPALPHPHWLFWLAWCCLLLALCLRAARPALPPAGRRLLAAAALCGLAWLALLPCWRQELRFALLDVGQGQAALLESPRGWRLLADGGNLGPRFDCGAALVIPRVCFNRLPALDAVLMTHPDMDHLGGLFAVLEQLRVGTLLHNGEAPEGRHAARWQTLLHSHDSRRWYAGDSLELGDGLTLEVLHPPRGCTREGNNASLVLRLTRSGEGLLLLTGDAERPAIKTMLATGADMRARVVVAPHHGADSAFFAALYDAAQPDIILVSCGRDGRWAYPGEKLRTYAEKHHIPLLTTSALGEIALHWGRGEGWQLEHARAVAPEYLNPDRLESWLAEE